MQLSNHHKQLDKNGEGKCSVPMWRNGWPDGFCDQPAYGERTEDGKKRYSGYVGALACFSHGGPEKPY